MIKNNLLGQILIGLLVFFLLLSSVQMFGWGQGIDKVELNSENPMNIPSVPTVNDQSNNEKPDDKQIMDTIITRPMFSDTRTPFIAPETTLEGGVEGDYLETSELNAQLTGVVITPQGSYAMILDGISNKKDTYEVGMPLSGDQGGWTLNSIQSRKVVFVSGDDKTEELELKVFTSALKAGGTSKKVTRITKQQKDNSKKPDNQEDKKKDKKKNADDIRKKIAERRAQMRAEAANKSK